MTIKLNKALASRKILTKSGNPQATPVILLEEIINQYHLTLKTSGNGSKPILCSPLEAIGWKTNYHFFEEKFGYKRYKTRYSLVALEKYGLVTRKALPTPRDTKQGGSDLYLILNLDKVEELLDF